MRRFSLTGTMTIIMAALLAVALPTAAADAQGMKGGRKQRTEQKADPNKKKADDRAYNDALSKIPNGKKYDPWQSMR